MLRSQLHQQAVVDTAGDTFTAVFQNIISSANAFAINGSTFKLGEKGQALRSTVTGQLNAAPPPTGYFYEMRFHRGAQALIDVALNVV
jgi:hypothetical protein